MAKNKTVYKCLSCGKEYVREPIGKCSSCGAFQNFTEVQESSVNQSSSQAGLKTSGALKPSTKARTINELKNSPISRTKTGIEEFDRVLGGGFVDAEVVLVGGQAGTGKSTIALDIASRYAKLGKTVLYSSGEESEQQIGLRASRMGIVNENIKIVNETSLEVLLGHIADEKPELLIVDSLQTLASSEISSSIGSIQQSKEAAHTLTRLAKNEKITMILVNQLVKSGEYAGSESIKHIVDAALMFESDSETPLKFLRAEKNRFGDTSEVGIFQHSETGLEEVTDPSGVFIDNDNNESLSGTSLSFISEGVRQIPVEIQALASSSNLPTPRKQFNGVNFNRGQIVCAILDKFCRTRLYENDVFVNTISGIKINDPLADLSIAASLLSSLKNKTFKDRTAFIGELSLTGQVRGAFMIENKIREADRLGFDRIVIPKSAMKNLSSRKYKIKVETISSIKDIEKMLS